MSDRPLLAPNLDKPIINGASMDADITGPATIIQLLPGLSYDLAWTGNPVGTFQVQVSNTYRQAPNGTITNAGHWTTIPSSAFSGTYPAPSGSTSNGFIDLFGISAYAVRLHYTAVSGSGALTVIPCAKVW